MRNPYREMEIRTASPLQLVVRMYEGALRHVRSAMEHDAAGRVKSRADSLARGLAIVTELRGALDLERGGEVARNLDELYAYSIDRLIDANLKGNAQGLREVIPVLEQLHSAWAELERTPPEALGSGP